VSSPPMSPHAVFAPPRRREDMREAMLRYAERRESKADVLRAPRFTRTKPRAISVDSMKSPPQRDVAATERRYPTRYNRHRLIAIICLAPAIAAMNIHITR